MTMTELKARHPMPWKYLLMGNNVVLADATGKELPMFIMLDFMCQVTQQIQAEATPA